jgi:fructose-bisphosphate aldolase class II
MVQGVEDFVYALLTDVFNAGDTAPLAIEAILRADSHDLGFKTGRTEDPSEWSEAKIAEKATTLAKGSGAAGDFDD